MLRRSLTCSLLILSPALAQSPYEDGRHVVNAYPIVGDVPTMGIEVTRLEYTRNEAMPMAFDLYRPERRDSTPLPVVVMASATRSGSMLTRAQYVSWARKVASAGMAAIVYESSWATYGTDFEHLLYGLHAQGTEWGVDADRIGTLACSGNVDGLYGRIVDPAHGIRCAVLYYGAPRVYASPGQVDLLVVTAGRDLPSLNERIQDLIKRVQSEERNVEHIFHAQGHHAFDILDDTDHTRAVIDRTVGFWRTSLSAPSMQGSGSLARRALAHYFAEEWTEAMDAYGEYVEVEPEDPNGWFRRGVAAGHARAYLPATEAFERSAELGLRPRETYYDAACMCALAGEPARALDLLSAALDSGFRNWNHLDADNDLASVRALPAYKGLMEAFR